MNRVRVSLLTFGFQYGMPEADMVLDMRGLNNPFYVPELKDKTGLDREVQDYIFSFPESREYLQAVVRLVHLRLQMYERYIDKQPKHLTFAIGCTGGRHRSVAMALALARELTAMGYAPSVEHRELRRWKEA